MPYYNLLEETLKHATFASEIVSLKKVRTQHEEKIHQNNKELDRIDLLLKNADIEQVLQEDLDAYKQQHLQYFDECRQHLTKILK
jgi:hypothetical protein